MSGISRAVTVFVLASILSGLAISVSFAQPHPGPGRKTSPKTGVSGEIPTREGVTIPDDPQIREFLANPASAPVDGRITLRWRVEPSVSSISSVNISSPALGLNVNSSDAGGSYTHTIPARVGPGRYHITLTATNAAGRTSTPHVVEVNVFHELNVRIRLWSSEFSEGDNLHLFLTLRNEGEEVLRDVMAFIFYGGREIVRVDPFPLRSGSIREYDFHLTGAARAGTYTVEVRVGDRVLRSEFRTESVRYHIPMPR